MNGDQTFGHWLRDRRMGLGFTQRQLAERVPCARVTIQKIESGRRRPSCELSELLARHLQVPPEECGSLVAWARQNPDNASAD